MSGAEGNQLDENGWAGKGRAMGSPLFSWVCSGVQPLKLPEALLSCSEDNFLLSMIRLALCGLHSSSGSRFGFAESQHPAECLEKVDLINGKAAVLYWPKTGSDCCVSAADLCVPPSGRQ